MGAITADFHMLGNLFCEMDRLIILVMGRVTVVLSSLSITVSIPKISLHLDGLSDLMVCDTSDSVMFIKLKTD